MAEVGRSSAPPSRSRLIVADNHAMFAEALGTALADDHLVVGTVSTGAELRALAAQRPVDCILLGLMMPGGGLELIPVLRGLQPAAKILIVTVLENRAMARAAVKAGANGFVPKIAGIAELRRGITEVLAGRTYVSPRVPRTTRRIGTVAAHPALVNLTRREHEVLLLFGEAMAETEIASQLGIDPSTVTRHKESLMEKLGVSSTAALVKFAVMLVTGFEGPP